VFFAPCNAPCGKRSCDNDLYREKTLNAHLQREQVPPRSWEQFEELCADTFQAAWKDPGLVRNGRAGQRQHGVDIVARQGSHYPVGIQCKKKKQWPVVSLSKAEIDKEIALAQQFKPPLRSFYIVTTAENDARLDAHIRTINQKHEAAGLFSVFLLGWSEVVRRALLDVAVADKHFGPWGGAARAPLLATWFSSNGRLEFAANEFPLVAKEIAQDFFEEPSGRFAFRERETDALLEKINALPMTGLTLKQREQRIALRDELRRHTNRASRVVKGVSLMLTDETIASYLIQVWPEREHLASCLQQFIVGELDPAAAIIDKTFTKLRLTSPCYPEDRVSAYISPQAVREVLDLQQARSAKFGRPATDTVDELPSRVRAQYAIPAIIRHLLRKQEERVSLDDLRSKDYLNLGSWKVEMG
jgi:hypothetical protein